MNFQKTNTSARHIYHGIFTLNESENGRSDWLVEILNSRKQVKPKNIEKKQQKKDVLEDLSNLFEGRKRILNAFDSKIFPLKIESTGFLDKVSDHFKSQNFNS